jgi:glycosyltransferase involved in cell wall biosynthesis
MERSLSKKEEFIKQQPSSHNKYNLKSKKTLVIAWAHHSIRSKKIAYSLNSNFFIKGYRSRAKILSIIKYIRLSLNTLDLLQKEKPDIIICQIPAYFLGYFILLYKFLTFSSKPNIILDLHTAAFHKPWTYFGFINDYLFKKSLYLIVTNKQLLSEIDFQYKNKVLILEDPIFDLPEIKNNNKITTSQLYYTLDNNYDKSFKIGIICSFAADEPISEIIASTQQITNVKFFISGDYNRLHSNLLDDTPSHNLQYTGFLEYSDFIKLMSSMDVIMVLTKRDKTLLSGCYEALMLEKPIITSNFEVLQDSFNKGAIFVDNSVPQILNAIKIVQNNYCKLKEEIKQLKEEKNNEWNTKIEFLKSTI